MNRPLILDFAKKRSESAAKVPYRYDKKRDLNTVILNGEQIPFITSGLSTLELLTKTEQSRESDDDSIV